MTFSKEFHRNARLTNAWKTSDLSQSGENHSPENNLAGSVYPIGTFIYKHKIIIERYCVVRNAHRSSTHRSFPHQN